MAIEGILKVGGNSNSYDENNFVQKSSYDDNCLFNLKFEPEAFGGKTANNLDDTSIFDSWDA